MAATIVVKWQGMKEAQAIFDRAGLKAPYALGRALDEVGNKAKTQLTRAVAAQSGLPYGKAKACLNSKQAMGAGNGSYVITARDVYHSLKEFSPSQGAKGVTARPWNKSHLFPHSFIGPGGHVYVRLGKPRLPIHKLMGPNIAVEMTRDDQPAPRVFYNTCETLLPPILIKWLLRALG